MQVSISDFVNSESEALQLKLVAGETGLEKRFLINNELNRPGLQLSGYLIRFPYLRVQILGETEIAYLMSLSPEKRIENIRAFMSYEIPLILISKNQLPSEEMIKIANETGTPILNSPFSTTRLIKCLELYLDTTFAPRTIVHGSLVDVYGVGLLITGRSGIGKSECVLDLIERGHRLIGDDSITIICKEDVLLGTGNDKLGYHMEIRGLGIIDIEDLFGVRSVRIQKRIEVEVHLEDWDDDKIYDRLGLEEEHTNILGVNIPFVTIPIVPGKNLTVISEIIAMNHMVKAYGRNAAKSYNERLKEMLKDKAEVKRYLRKDKE